jgi:TPR repeat protein
LFWAASRSAYRLGFIAGATALTVVAGIGLFAVLHFSTPTVGEAPPDSAQIEETLNRAKLSDPMAQHDLARMYGSGRGVPQSEKDKVLWLERAAEQGNADAQYQLGIALRNGQGVIQDFASAATWLQRAAQSGNGWAQYELGRLYSGGIGIKADNVKAYMWFNLAAAQGIGGADAARDAALKLLSPSETREAQAESRRISEAQQTPSASAR